jgi:hypothetical protein
MIRTQISVDADLYAKAKEVARRQRISLVELCRRSLAEALARMPNTKQPWMSLAGSNEGSPDDSATVDEVVYGRKEP